MKRLVFEDEHEQLRATARQFLEKECAPHAEKWESERLVDRESYVAAGKYGLIGFGMPEEYGGGGVEDFRFNAVVDEEFAKFGSATPGVGLQNDVVGPYFASLATNEQKERWLPGFITGEGESFCAGADLKAISRRENLYHPDHAEWAFAGYVHHFIDKPTIDAVNGTALGGGTELALASDLVVAEERAKFGLPEVKRGLIAAAGGVFRIVDHLPRKVALELLFTGEPMSSADALKWVLINQVVPDGTAAEAALTLAERITVNAALAVGASKRVAYGVITGDEPDWNRTMREIGAVLKSEDAKEGLLVFAEKRQPVWKAQ